MRWIALYIVFSGGWGWGFGRKTTSDMHLTRYSILVVWSESDACALPCLFSSFQGMVEEVNLSSSLRGCLHDTGATFAPEWVHSGSLSWLYICLHDTTTKKCHARASHPCVSSPRLLYRGENFTPVRNLATVSCKRETHFGVKSVCR